MALEKALSPDNPPQRFTTAFTYQLPIGPGKHFLGNGRTLGKVIGGWELSGILTFESGFPIPITGPNNLFLFNDVNTPDTVLGVSPKLYHGGKFNPAADLYLNPAAFTLPPPFTFGTSAQVLPNARDFATRNVDLALMKRFFFGETRYVEFRNEWFNATNRVRFGTPAGSYGQVGFGEVSSQANSPRAIQFALKIVF